MIFISSLNYISSFSQTSPSIHSLDTITSDIDDPNNYFSEISFPSFPESINYEIDIVFIGINQTIVNTTFLAESLPQISQISRYVPLSYQYETYINYSINYRFLFMDFSFAEFLSASMSYSTYGYTVDMATFWLNRTTVDNYKRLNCYSARNAITANINKYKTQDDQIPSIIPTRPTIFIGNFFFNGSNLYINSSAAPHVYSLEKYDMDTLRLSSLRNEAKFAPGFDWEINRWLFLDISSGPSPYETISEEYTNYIDLLFNSTTMDELLLEWSKLLRSVVFSRFVPTYLYEPVYYENIDLRIVLYQDSDNPTNNYINLYQIEHTFNNTLPFSNISVDFQVIDCTDGCLLYEYLDYISDITDYAIWATKLIEFITDQEDDIFGSYLSNGNNIRYLMGIFSSNLITNHESSLGYTWGEFGSAYPTASVTTISQQRILDAGEGLTQTTLHEMGHQLSFRHPHDYRYNDLLYKLWCWDISSSPMNYMYPVYDYNKLDLDFLYRGQYRYLFNKSLFLIDEIKNKLISKNFPENYYPISIRDDFQSISSSMSTSLIKFIQKEYYNSLSYIIPNYLQLKTILNNVSSLRDYFQPIINFNTINESVMDFGDNIDISGSIVTYSPPNGYITRDEISDTLNFTQISSEPNLYESKFAKIISGTDYGSIDSTVIITVFFLDGVKWYRSSINITFKSIEITILSPFDQMNIDLSNSKGFNVFGHYFSFSNSSKIDIIYGSEWYVHDYSDNDLYWMPVNKSSGNEWIYPLNVSYLVNGKNIIKVRVSNEIISDEKSIAFFISGLPQENIPINATTTITSTTNNSNNFINQSENFFNTIFGRIFMLILIIFTIITIHFSYSLYKKNVRPNLTKNLSEIRHTDHSNSITTLKETVEKKMQQREEIQKNKSLINKSKKNLPQFKRRRRKY